MPADATAPLSPDLAARRLQGLSRGLALACALIGALVVTGWMFRIETLRALYPGFISMQPRTAVSLLFLAIAVGLSTLKAPPRAVIFALCGVVFASSAAALFEYATHLNLGTDLWLFPREVAHQAARSRHPGRMAEGTAASLAGMAFGLSIHAGLRRPVPAWLHVALCGLPSLIGGVSLLGHLLDIPPVRGVIGFTDIAIPTAAGLCLLSIAMLSLRDDIPWLKLLADDTVGGEIARRMLPVFVGLPALIGWLAWQATKAGLITTEFRLVLVILGTTLGLLAVGLECARRLALSEIRLRAEKTLLASSEARLKTVIDHAHQAIVTLNERGIITGWNAQAEFTFGWTAGEAVGKPMTGLIVHADLREAYDAKLGRFLAGGGDVAVGERLELEGMRRSGEVFPVELAISALRGDNGWEITALMHDISSRRAQTALFENAFETAPIGMALVALDGRLLKVNDSFLRIIGYGSDEALSLDFQAITHPDDLAADLDGVKRLLAGEADAYRMDKRYIRKDGAVVWTALSVSMAYAENGAPAHFVSQIEDLTERRAAEGRYRLLADHASDMVTLLDIDGRCLYMSPSCERLLGHSPDALIDRTPLDFVDAEDRVALRRAYVRLRRAAPDDDLTHVTRLRRQDGGLLWVEVLARRVEHEDGRTLIAANVRDISARVAAQSALETAKVAAEAATAAKSEFLANMSHEIRTPLTAIIGYTGLLAERSDLAAPARHQVERVESAGKALLSIVNDVLDFSKLEAGHFEIKPRVVSPLDEVRSAIQMFAPQADAKGLALEFHAADDLPAHVRLDPDRLRQILLNLVSNAMKFTTQGEVRVSVRFDAAAEQLHVAVRDTGPGLDEDQQTKLFQRFSQVDASRTRSHGGTGLGLAICKGLAEAMGGDIGVESARGAGSTFAFNVAAPRAQADEVQPAERAQPLDATGARILVVDDNPANRELARVVLEMVGAQVTEASSGEAALEIAQAQAFDLILLDIRMPGMDGPAVLAALRSTGGPNLTVPVLAFTADADLAWLSEGDIRFDDVVRKPIEAAGLIQSVLRWTSPGDEGDSDEGAETQHVA